MKIRKILLSICLCVALNVCSDDELSSDKVRLKGIVAS
jgi:hypothetical protein